MSEAKTRAQLEAAGHSKGGPGKCRSCNASIEWWTTRDGNHLPMDPTPEPDSPAVAHFATCPNAAQHRRKR